MHLALKAYQELLLTVNEMDRSQDENIRQSSNVIKSKMLTAHVQIFIAYKIRILALFRTVVLTSSTGLHMLIA